MSYDAIVIGSGAGGATFARRMAEHGKHVLVIERGGYVPREPANWSALETFQNGRYISADTWRDSRGHAFQPQSHYNVGGATKFYGAALFRLRDRDLLRWPALFREDIGTYYGHAENWYNVHTLPHAPVIQRIAGTMSSRGLNPEYAPCGIIDSKCIRCNTCDGFACMIHAKADAETCGIVPALATGNVTVMTDTRVKWLTYRDGKIVSLFVKRGPGDYTDIPTHGVPVILAAGAVNSAALWLQSGIPDSSGMAGQNFMMHVSQAVLAIGRERLAPAFHKTLAMLDWYDTLGSVQMAGQVQAPMLRGESALARHAPGMPLREVASRAVTFWLMSEDSPHRDNRVTVDSDGNITLSYRADRTRARMLYSRLAHMMPAMGFPVHMRKWMPLAAIAHQCGTLRMGDQPYDSVVNHHGQAWNAGNLYVGDASVFRTAGAVNPALTVMAHAMRLADYLGK